MVNVNFLRSIIQRIIAQHTNTYVVGLTAVFIRFHMLFHVMIFLFYHPFCWAFYARRCDDDDDDESLGTLNKKKVMIMALLVLVGKFIHKQKEQPKKNAACETPADDLTVADVFVVFYPYEIWLYVFPLEIISEMNERDGNKIKSGWKDGRREHFLSPSESDSFMPQLKIREME